MIMPERIFKELVLTELQPSPDNPRKNYSGPKFEEFVASVRKVGVIEPILVRPKTIKHSNVMYEIVAGERRFRAKSIVASENGGPEHATIPAIVQEMTDDEAFDLMTIENLQREDLTEIEEAQSFKIYLDKKGKDALPELAERTGIKPQYIRRRVAVLTLPDKVIKAWEDGKIKYGHCEQLVRVKDKKLVQEYLDRLLTKDNWHRIETVHDLKKKINDHAIPLKNAKFELEAAGCLTCSSNTDCQSALFEDEKYDGVYCTNSVCFKQNQGKWLKANWKKHGKQAGTNGFRFEDELTYGHFNNFSCEGNPGEKCKECSHFVSRVKTDGKFEDRQVCVGDKSCFDQIIKAGKPERNAAKKKLEKALKGEKVDADLPRVAWHGEFFREGFYKNRIPEAISALNISDLRCLQLSLMAMIKSNSDSRIKFANQWIPKYEKKNITWCHDVEINDVWKRIISMTADEVSQAHRDLAREIIMQTGIVTADERHWAAAFLDIDLAKEWRFTQEYLDKKTTKEIMDMIVRFAINKDEKAQKFLYEKLGKKRGKFESCKKAELVSLMLESGIDLAGKVPAEILKVGK